MIFFNCEFFIVFFYFGYLYISLFFSVSSVPGSFFFKLKHVCIIKLQMFFDVTLFYFFYLLDSVLNFFYCYLFCLGSFFRFVFTISFSMGFVSIKFYLYSFYYYFFFFAFARFLNWSIFTISSFKIKLSGN
jgi:hypothetical protein